jgi:hypothetical protein
MGYPQQELSMSLQLGIQIGAAVSIVIIILLFGARRRLGVLNAATWLVIWGALIIATEHPVFAIAFSIPVKGVAEELRTHPMTLLPHARTHFFMAGIYTLIALVLLGIIARTLLREGRRAGWYAVLFALIFGGGAEVAFGGLWFQHGSPLYALFGHQPTGFGWEFLYTYFVAWIVALVIAYRPIFAKAGGLDQPAQMSGS